MNSNMPALGKGRFLTNDKKTNPMSPDYKGELILSKDYKQGERIKLAGWIKKTPKGVLISIAEDNWKPEAQNQYPREVNRNDEDVPF